MEHKILENGLIDFTDKVVGQAKVIIDITEEDVDNIIVCCFEGGSNYWLGLKNDTEDWDNQPNNVPTSQWATKLLLEGKEVLIVDFEEDKDYENPFSLTLEKLLNGIALNNRERTWASDKENWDSTDCDCILQYALFGEVVYA